MSHCSAIPVTAPHRFEVTNSLEVRFSLVLWSVIDSTKKDPAQLRHMVYELARFQLEQEARKTKDDGSPSVNVDDVPGLMLAFEAAVRHVERFSCEQEELPCAPAVFPRLRRPIHAGERSSYQQPRFDERDLCETSNYGRQDEPHRSCGYNQPSGSVLRDADAWVSPSLHKRDEPNTTINPAQKATRTRPVYMGAKGTRVSRSGSGAATGLRGLAVGSVFLVASIGAYAALKPTRLTPQTSVVQAHGPTLAQTAPAKSPILLAAAGPAVIPQPLSEDSTTAKSSEPQGAPLPLPSVYGVYAVSDGKLVELEPLPGRVPDKVFMSSPINSPSHVQLPSGRAAFIVFRREIANSAPDRVAVRVVAKISQALKFPQGKKAEATKLDDVWTVRNISHDFRVAPLSQNPEMLVLRPEEPEFLFSPGRYALVLKGQAYDFTVLGEITDPAQCLERTEAANGTFYSECKRMN